MKPSVVLVLLAFYLAPSHGTATTNIENIVCGDNGQGISFALEIPDFSEWSNADAATWKLGSSNDASCQPSFTNIANRVSYANFNGSTCGTLTDGGDNLIYTFTISAAPSGGAATHRYDHSYTIQCLYNKNKTGIQANFIPQHSVSATDQANGTLIFTFQMLLASDNSLVNPATTYDLKTQFKGQLTVTDSGFPDKNFDVHFTKVEAANNDQNNSPTTLITNGCSGNTDLASHSTCANTTEESFTLHVFRFAGQTTGNQVYIFITAEVCLDGGGTTECETECAACVTPGRRRRNTLEESVKARYYLKYGPLKVADLEKEEKADTVVDEDEGSSVPVHVLVLGVVGGVVAVAIVCVAVILVLRKRRCNATLAKSTGAHEVATPRV